MLCCLMFDRSVLQSVDPADDPSSIGIDLGGGGGCGGGGRAAAGRGPSEAEASSSLFIGGGGTDDDDGGPLSLDVSRLQFRIPGYEDVGHHRGDNNGATGFLISPPGNEEEVCRKHSLRISEEELANFGYITEDEAQEVLLATVSQHCCYGKSAAKDLEIYRIISTSALHYSLETFTENRSTSWDQEPYKGQKIDGPSNGSAPLPWDIHCNPTRMFHSEVRFLEVPHTATVACCYDCAALGWIRCHSCVGRGFTRCISCCGSGRLWRLDAHGRRHVDSCWHCHGTGRKRCSCCEGDGRLVCQTCQGYRNLKCYIKLRVEYNNNQSEHIIEHTDLPTDLIKAAGGEYLLEQTQPKVWPITDYPEQELCNASHSFLQRHLTRARNSRILMQRQKLRIIAISECSYTWVNTEGRFWVYGKEMSVHAPDYPQKYCWGCTIL